MDMPNNTISASDVKEIQFAMLQIMFHAGYKYDPKDQSGDL